MARNGLDAHNEMGEALFRLFLALFYADDGVVASRDPELLQRALGILSRLFERVGLGTNTKKTQTMICVPGKIRTRLSTASYHRKYGGFGTARAWESRRAECDACGADLAASSLASHLETQHGVFQAAVLEEEFLVQNGRKEQVYSVHQSADGKF